MGVSAEHDCRQRGCFLAATPTRLQRRASADKIDLDDLLDLVEATGGACMICRRCHASNFDRGRTGSNIRGIVCPGCRSRLSRADGAAGHKKAPSCSCDEEADDWRLRAGYAIEQYLDRASRSASGVPASRAAFTTLVAEVQARGVDPGGAWTKPADQIPSPPEITRPLNRPRPPELRELPLRRTSCEPQCLAHDAGHIYVACFDEPTTVKKRDFHPDDPDHDYPLRHYVGWTGQQPPSKRIAEHGRATREGVRLIVPGTEAEECVVKRLFRCPRCGEELWYYQGSQIATN